jgi:hypothetical protein
MAMLPSVGSASEDERHALDAALRRTLERMDESALQPAATTRAHVLSMAEMGVVCIADDVPCLVKFGLLASVSTVLVPVAARARGVKDGRALDIEIGVIDVAAGQRVRAVGARLAPSNGSGMDELVRGALGMESVDPKPKEPTPSEEPPPDDGRPPDPPPPTQPATPGPLATAGMTVAGVGGGLAALGVGSGALLELAWAGILPVAASSRRDVIQPAGVAVWVGTMIATASAGAGLLMYALAPPDDGNEKSADAPLEAVSGARSASRK